MMATTHPTKPTRHDGSPMPMPVPKAILSDVDKPLVALAVAVSVGNNVDVKLGEEDDHTMALLFGYELTYSKLTVLPSMSQMQNQHDR